MRCRAVPALLVALAAGCESGPPVASEEPEGPRMTVHLLDDAFVRYADRRITVEEFIYEVRVRCREAAGDATRIPWIEVRAPGGERAGSVPAGVVDAIQADAGKAGVRHIQLVTEGS